MSTRYRVQMKVADRFFAWLSSDWANMALGHMPFTRRCNCRCLSGIMCVDRCSLTLEKGNSFRLPASCDLFF